VSEVFTRIWPDRAQGLAAADLAGALERRDDTRPFVAVNMIATADGRATIAGRTGPIANRADYELFHATRARMDAIMVGAETVRVESYGRTINSAEARERREREGKPADIVTVVASRSVSLPSDVGLLKAKENVVIVLTPSPDAQMSDGAAATVRYLRDEDMVAGVRRLRTEQGLEAIVCEGGPNLNATLLPAGVVDELHLVYAPKLAGGADPLTILTGPELDPPIELELITLHESGGYLFCRYGVRAGTAS
jgi:riboflavin-specific deaminase-like protein